MSHINIPYEDLSRVNAKYYKDLVQKSSQIIKSGRYILGAEVNKFEQKFQYLNKSKYCIGVASGLDALILGLVVFDFPKGKKVLIPSNAYIASILAVIKAGLVPVLVEPDLGTYNMSIQKLVEAYDNDCVAILPVHLYGRLSQMDQIIEFAKEKGLKVIEDCAQSHFAMLEDRYAGTFGDIGAFSFYPTKNLGALGDSGAILCKDESIYKKLIALRNYGSEKKYFNKFQGYNSRLDEIQAAFLNVKLDDIHNVIAHKREIAGWYLKGVKSSKYLKLPQKANEEHVWHIFNILSPFRDELREYLLINGISTEIHYPVAPHKQEGFIGMFQNQEFPISELIHSQTLSLPISTFHTKAEVEYIIQMVNLFFEIKEKIGGGD